MRVDGTVVVIVILMLISAAGLIYAYVNWLPSLAPECSAEQAEVLGPGTYKCLTLENGTRRWWKVEE